MCLELHIIINNYIQNVNTNPSRFLLELKTKHEIQTGHKKNQTNTKKRIENKKKSEWNGMAKATSEVSKVDWKGLKWRPYWQDFEDFESFKKIWGYKRAWLKKKQYFSLIGYYICSLDFNALYLNSTAFCFYSHVGQYICTWIWEDKNWQKRIFQLLTFCFSFIFQIVNMSHF